jgi:hypothetical protein
LATGIVVAAAIVAILAVYVCLRAFWNDTDPGARMAVAAFLVLAPVGYLLFSAFVSAIFIDLIVPAAVSLVHPDVVPIIENDGLAIGATMLAMSMAIG